MHGSTQVSCSWVIRALSVQTSHSDLRGFVCTAGAVGEDPHQVAARYPRSLAGRNSRALTTARIASTAQARTRKGIESSHTTGSRTNAARANGHATASSTHQIRKAMNTFIGTRSSTCTRFQQASTAKRDGAQARARLCRKRNRGVGGLTAGQRSFASCVCVSRRGRRTRCARVCLSQGRQSR